MGQYDSIVDSIAQKIKSGQGVYDPKLLKASTAAQQRLATSPALISSGKYDTAVKDIEKIVLGQKPSTSGGGGVLGALGSVVGKSLSGLGYVLGAPARAVTSLGKETVDLFQGEGFSPKDFVTQIADKDFYASKFVPKVGNKFVDAIIGLGADIVTDPLFWAGTSSLRYAGRSGRVALANEAAKKGIQLGMPELVNKYDDIVRAGTSLKSFTDAERKVLGIEKGFRWNWAKGNPLVFNPESTAGKISGAIGQGIAGPTASLRARLGDPKWMRPIQEYVRPASYSGTMNRLGRNELTPLEALREGAQHSSSVRSRAERAISEDALVREHAGLLEEIGSSPFRQTVFQVAEGSRVAVDPAEQALADKLKSFYESVFGKINTKMDEYNVRRSLSAPRVNEMSDYGVNHTLSKEAKDFWFNGRWKKSQYRSQLEKSLELTGSEVAYGPDITRARKLVAGEEWLGETLKYGTVDEINRISQKKLGFKWFEEDAAVLMKDYIASASDQIARISFMDGMFDFGDDVVRAIGREIVSDRQLYKGLDSALKASRDVFNEANNILVKLQGEARSTVLTPAANRAQRRVTGRAASATAREAKVDLGALRASVLRAQREVDVLSALASTKTAKEVGDLYDVLKPLRRRLDDLDAALASANAAEEVAIQALTSNYRRVFGLDAAIPDNPSDMLKALRGENIPKASGARAEELAARAGAGEDVAQTMRLASNQQQALESAQKVRTGENVLSRAEATKESAALTKDIAGRENALSKALASDPVIKAAKAAPEAEVAAVTALDNAEALAMRDDLWEQTVRPALQTQIDAVREQGARAGIAGDMSNSWADETDRMLKAMKDSGFFTPEEMKAWDRVYTSLKASEVALAQAEATYKIVDVQTKLVKQAIADKQFGTKVVEAVEEGWKKIESLGIQMPQEQYDLLFAKVKELRTPQGINTLNKLFAGYNQFFKVSAMFSPGFITRNAYSAAWNNFLRGVTVADSRDAMKFMRLARQIGFEEALAKVPAAQREVYDLAFRGVAASGMNMSMDILTQPVLGKKTASFMNLRGVKAWEKANTFTEDTVRMALGLRLARDGQGLDSIAQGIALSHFDYSDLSKLDKFAKQYVPFWTWTTRNIPLQIISRAVRPGPYRAYESLQRSLAPEDGSILPLWLSARGPLTIGKDTYLNPDLPFIDMNEQIRRLSDPLQLLSQLYPQYKLPIELAGNRRLGLNIPFSEKPQPIRGPLDWPALLAGAITGQAMETATGPAVSDKVAYALGNLIPLLGNAQRLVPQAGGPEKYEERQLSTALSWLGAPVRTVGPQQKESELTRREFAMKDYLDSLRRRGYLESNR